MDPRLPDARLGQILAEKYELTAVLGVGGAGVVYEAVQHPLGRPVAVKMLRSDITMPSDADFEGRFFREAAVASRLSHPNVVTVFDFGVTAAGECFVVMELLRGETLKQYLTGRALHATEAARLAMGICRGLRHAHAQGLVHRDVKPSNVMLVEDDEGLYQPKVFDFGLVKDVDAEATRSGLYMGTPTYVAPEQAKGDPNVDHRADQYSLGVVLYRMLTGKVPFRGEGPMATAVAQIQEPYPRMSQRAPELYVDPMLEAVVERAMAKNPAHRFSDVGQLARALREWSAASTSISSLVLPPSSSLQEPPKRLSGGWVAAILVALAGVFGLAAAVCGVVWSWTADGPDATPVLAPIPREVAPVEFAPVEPVPVDPLTLEDGGVEPSQPDAGPPRRATSAEPAPVPAPPVAVAPRPRPAPRPTPAPPARPAPRMVSGPAVVVDGVRFEASHAERALTWLNSADEGAVRTAGVYGRGVGIILEQRPFASLDAFGSTPFIGEKTVQAVADATR